MEKIHLSLLASGIGKRIFSPKHAINALRLHKQKGRVERTNEDAQLELYSKIIGDYLHLGYFEDPNTPPESISLDSIRTAQERYSQRILDYVTNPSLPVLDVGCGMGGLLRKLEKLDLVAVGVTPDRRQVDFLRNRTKFPIWNCRFEDIPNTDLNQRFGTVIMSESLQYLDRHRLFEKLDLALAKTGRWIAVDYLEFNNNAIKPSWQFIERELPNHGFNITMLEDITPHILPTIRFMELLGQRFAIPIFDFLEAKLKQREPGLAYVLDDAICHFRRILVEHLSVVNAQRFIKEKSCRLLVAERRR